ncbi:response regulator transcription factor [Paenalcaligenes hominis]|uniref:response regulator transcription factor n=1 Tax=Paenalcaligenes hominis TaxID=643674 RepID=UPI0035242F01
MSQQTIYLFTQDDFLAQHLKRLTNELYVTKKVETLQELHALEPSQLVIVDSICVQWRNVSWQEIFTTQNVLVATLKPNDSEGQDAFLLGAKAYAQAYSAPEHWLLIIQQVQAGQVWLGQSLLSRLLSQVSSHLPQRSNAWQAELTPREIDVAQRAALGHSNALIAEDLGISERTVRAHLGAIFNKLNISDRLMLVLKVHGLK